MTIIYHDDVIEVCIIADTESEELKNLAIRYLEPKSYKGMEGQEIQVTNVMGGETDWFILPFTFGIAIGKKLFEQKGAGLSGFSKKGFKELKEWLIEMEEIDDAMCLECTPGCGQVILTNLGKRREQCHIEGNGTQQNSKQRFSKNFNRVSRVSQNSQKPTA